MGKEIFTFGGKLFLKLIIVNIMCFFIIMSFSVLSTAAFTKNIGYTAYGTTSESSEQQELYTYYYDDGEDTKLKEYEDSGVTVSKSTIRSPMSKTGNILFLTVSQVFSLLILIAFIYPNIWDLGTKDSNLVRFKHKEEDRLKGLKIGLVAVIPLYLARIALVVFKLGAFPKFPLALHRFFNSSFYALIQAITGKAGTVGEASWWRIILLFLPPIIIPAIAWLAYALGIRNFSIGEKLIYKKNKE